MWTGPVNTMQPPDRLVSPQEGNREMEKDLIRKEHTMPGDQ